MKNMIKNKSKKQAGTHNKPSDSKHKEKQQKESKETISKEVALFSHLEIAKGANTSLAPKDIHPAVIVIGLQFAEFKICGANARCIATLTAFKKVSKLH